MNTPLIEMCEFEAAEKAKAYKRMLGARRGKALSLEVKREYEQALAGFKVLAKGLSLIDLEAAMRAGGFDEKGRPKLAIGRADRDIMRFSWQGIQGVFEPRHAYSGAKDVRRVMFEYRPIAADFRRGDWTTQHDGYARVPLIPADVRPATGGEKDWFVLWEVEKWADSYNQIVPDKDPYLLKHVGGQLYAVLAEWDLTDLERAIMKTTAW